MACCSLTLMFTVLGAEGDSLMKVMHDFANVTSRSLDYHIKDSLVTIREAKVEVIRENVGKTSTLSS